MALFSSPPSHRGKKTHLLKPQNKFKKNQDQVYNQPLEKIPFHDTEKHLLFFFFVKQYCKLIVQFLISVPNMSVLCYLIVGLLFQIIYMADNTVRTHILSLQNIRQDFQLSKAQLILLVVKGIYTWKLPFSFTFRSMEHSAFLQGKKTTTTTTNLCLTHTFHFWQVLSETLRSIMEIINLR